MLFFKKIKTIFVNHFSKNNLNFSKNNKNYPQNGENLYKKTQILNFYPDLVLKIYVPYGKIVPKFNECDTLKLSVYVDDSLAEPKSSFSFLNADKNTRTSCQKENISIHTKRMKKNMANVRDAANYLIRLYYYGNKNCTSAAVQKLLIIAQMRSLYTRETALFDDDLFVKPLCFSIPFISNTYPDIIFDEDERIALKDECTETPIELPNLDNNSLPKLSIFYDFFAELSAQEIGIINDTYCAFGAFSGKCIGEHMRSLELHGLKPTFSTVTTAEISTYLNDIPLRDRINPIISFVCN